MRSFKEFFVEKNILGLEEDIIIDGVGNISAKLDTGNGAYNVLHGIDIENGKDHKTGETLVRFNTINNISIQKPIMDTVTINLGGGNVEERPVCMFSCKIGNLGFENIPFSIGNRSDNQHKVLIGKQFIKNELDALIDVSLNNVANQNIKVDT